MTSTASRYATIEPKSSKHNAAKKWLQRHLWQKASRPPIDNNEQGCSRKKEEFLQRPQTAPAAITTASQAESRPTTFAMLEYGSNTVDHGVERFRTSNSSVVRNVNAWLDTSMNTPNIPLMGGLSYWQEGTCPSNERNPDVQYAVPIVRDFAEGHPITCRSHRMRRFRCGKIKVQVQVQSFMRDTSTRIGGKQVNRQSASMPLIGLRHPGRQTGGYEMSIPSTNLVTRPSIPTRRQRLQRTSPFGQHAIHSNNFTHERSTSSHATSVGHNVERRINAMFKALPGRSASDRPATARANLVREASVGDLSDAPTYFTGPAPPSYRSRAESVLTTSSFGCIDGMTTEQRHMSKQKAARRRGVREKLKKFAQAYSH